ncbi:MAG: hypothetical protein EBE86_012120 [Hormoscilla sp. GUM202]|nr:hypothetical protein [Hormoscilla sp. GUM202]
MEVPELEITLTLDETNLILEALGAMPFARVHQLIAKIQQQAQSKIEGAQERKDSEKTPITENRRTE